MENFALEKQMIGDKSECCRCWLKYTVHQVYVRNITDRFAH